VRQLITAITATALALSLVGSAVQPAQAAVPGYNSSYFGESAFLTLNPGATGQFVAIFTNTGGTGWLKASASQVNLGACLDNKTTCNVAPEESAWNDGSWLSSIAYATTSTDFVGPGQNGFFVYNVKVPSTATAGSVGTFNGDLVLGSTLQQIRPEGYYQQVTVTAAATGSTATTYTGTAGGTVTGNGTATAPAGATVSGVTSTWSNITAGTSGAFGCSATDTNGFNELAEGFLCTGTVPGAASDLVKITTTGSYTNNTTSTETDYLGEVSRPVVVGSYSSTTGKFSGICPAAGAQDTQTAVTNIQYQLINALDGTIVRDYTDIPPLDGAYNETCESINFTPDASGVASGTTLTLNVRARDVVGYGAANSSTITASTTGDAQKPVITAAAVSRSSGNLRAKGTVTDNVAVASTQCKLQKMQSLIWNDVTGFVAATADDGAFNEPNELFTASFGAVALVGGTQYRAICNAADSSGNVSADFTTATFTDSAAATTPNASMTCTRTPTADTTNAASVVFTGTVTDPEGVANVQFAVTRGSVEPGSTTIQGYTNASPTDGAFNEVTEGWTYTFVFPTGTTTDGKYHFLHVVTDANGNMSDPLATDPGACASTNAGIHEDITVDRTAPLSNSAAATDAGTTGALDAGDTIAITFNEVVTCAAGSSLTISDGTSFATLVNGTGSTWTGCGTASLSIVVNTTPTSSTGNPVLYGSATIITASNGIADAATNTPNWPGSPDRSLTPG
jgi:hypothetical protein